MLTNNLSKILVEKNLTEEKLSEMIGMRQSSLNPIKNSKRIPRIDTALRIAKALKVPVERIWVLSDRTAA